jgi:hypothetical protein
MCIEFDCAQPAFVDVSSVFPTVVADMIVTVINGTLIIRLFALCVKYYTLFAHTHVNTSDFLPQVLSITTVSVAKCFRTDRSVTGQGL